MGTRPRSEPPPSRRAAGAAPGRTRGPAGRPLARAALGLAAACVLLGQSGWRLDGSGRYPGATPPLTWSAGQGVVWKVPLQAWSNASPVLAGDRLFVCEEPSTLVCVARATGEVLWRASNEQGDLVPGGSPSPADAAERLRALQVQERELRSRERGGVMATASRPDDAAAARELAEVRERLAAARKEIQALQAAVPARPPTHATNGYSSPTPLWDGENVYALFGTGVAVSFDRDGRRRWGRPVGRVEHGWGHSASPVLAGGRLILHIASTVYAVDPATGEAVWSSPSASQWGTPLPVEVGGETVVVTTGGDLLRASDGTNLAKLGPLPWTSPLADGGVLYFADQSGAAAYRLPAALSVPLAVEKLWAASIRQDRYYASPVLHEGLLYALTQTGHLTALDAATGAVAWERDLNVGGTAYPSLCLAGGLLYASGDTGATVVLRPGRVYEELARNQLEPFRSTPTFDGTRVYVRGLQHLYCLGT